MLQSTKRTLIAALLVGGAIAAPPAASARIFLDRQSPAASMQEIGTTLPQSGGVQTRSNGFDWAERASAPECGGPHPDGSWCEADGHSS